MKNRIKQLAVMVVFAFATQHIMAQEENGYVKVFEDFKEQYIGAANNQHLFYEASRKNPTAKSIKFYDEDMKFIKEEKVPFTIVGTQLIQNTYAKFIDSVQVETYNDMLLVRRVVSKKEGDMASYAYDEISWYDLNDLSKPKYTKQIKRLPNFPMMKTLVYKKYLNKYKTYNTTFKFVSKDRIAYLFETDFASVGGPEKINYKDIKHHKDRYLVVMDAELKIIFEGFVTVGEKENGKERIFEDEVKEFFVVNNEVIIHSLRNERIMLASKRKEMLNHFTIESEKEITSERIEITRAFGDKHNDKFLFTLSSDNTFLSSTYDCHKIEEGGKMEWEVLGMGICKYDIASKKMNSLYEFTFDREIMFPFLSRKRFMTMSVGNNIIAVLDRPFYTKGNLKFSTPGGTIDNMLLLVVLDKEWNMVSEKKIVYKSNIKTGVSDYQFFYNKKENNFSFLYMNVPTTIKQENKLLSNIDYLHTGAVQLKKYKIPVWDENNLKAQIGSHLFQLTFKEGKWEESHIPFPEELKYKKKSKTHGTIHLRSKLFTFSWFRYSNKNNQQSSFVTLPATPWDEVINLIKPNK